MENNEENFSIEYKIIKDLENSLYKEYNYKLLLEESNKIIIKKYETLNQEAKTEEKYIEELYKKYHLENNNSNFIINIENEIQKINKTKKIIDSLNEQDLIKEIKNKMYFLIYYEYEINLLKEEFKTMDNDKKLSLIASLKNELKKDANIKIEIESKESKKSNNNNIYSISEINEGIEYILSIENFNSDLDKKLKTEENKFSHIYKEVIDDKIRIYENKNILTILKEIFPDEEIDIKQFKEKLEEDGVSETYINLYNLIQEILGTEEGNVIDNVIYNFDRFMEKFSN